MKNNILVFNCGSSSIKFTIVTLNQDNTDSSDINGIVEGITTGSPYITIKYKNNKILDKQTLAEDNYEYCLKRIIFELSKIDHCTESLTAVGHRVVHGGEYFNSSVIIDKEVISIIESCSELAPLHNPANLMGIKIAQKEFPSLKNIACFDTAFHQTMPNRAYLYPLPYSWYKDHKVRRYGFHGMSHKYVSLKAAEFLNRDITGSNFITAHLGNGCSATAISKGHSIDTTMGFTPLEGLMMGTRSGSIDPGVIFYISEKLNITEKEVYNYLNKKSGLLGVSELSMDCRILEQEAENNNTQAILALEIFCYILAKNIASLAVALGSLDGLIFTGGIGENSSYIRKNTVSLLKILNLNLDDNKNNNLPRGKAGNIAVDHTTPILVIPTNEELMIAQDTVSLL